MGARLEVTKLSMRIGGRRPEGRYLAVIVVSGNDPMSAVPFYRQPEAFRSRGYQRRMMPLALSEVLAHLVSNPRDYSTAHETPECAPALPYETTEQHENDGHLPVANGSETDPEKQPEARDQ